VDIARRAVQVLGSVKVGSTRSRTRRALAIVALVAAPATPAAAAPAAPAPGARADRAPADRARADDVPLGQVKTRRFASDAGLKNLVVGSITQDAQGFLWVGTDDGVHRFDGERFTQFSIDAGLVSSLVHVVGEAPDGGVCVGAAYGLVCWDGARFAAVQGLPQVGVRTMVSFAGKLWVGTDAGLYVQEVSGGFVPAAGWRGGATPVRALWADAAGLVAGNGATVEVSTGNGEWQGIGDVGLGPDRVDGVLRDREGALWIRASSHMWHLPRGATRATDLRDGLPTAYDVVGAPVAMVIGPRGDVVIGTDDGIAVRDGDRWRIRGRQAGMPGTRALFVDREGTLWVGSNGLFQVRGRGLVEHYNEGNGLPGDVAWSFGRDREGTLWIGTNRCLARSTTAGWVCLPGTDRRVVRSFAFAPRGGVFVGGAPSDLLYVDPAGKPSSLGELAGTPEHHILALTLGPEGDLWIATKVGLYRLPGAVPGPPERVVVPGVDPGMRFAAFAVVGDQLWTTMQSGLAVLDRGVWRLFGTREGLRAASISYLTARRDGRMCVAYTEAIGLTCFRYDGRAMTQLEHIRPGDGLSTGMVYFLGEDRQQRLWVGTGQGLDVLTPHGLDHFDESDGLAGNDGAANAFLLDQDGSLWLGAAGGATHVLAQHYRGPPRAPSVYLDGQIGDRMLRGARGAQLDFELPHDRNAMTVELTAGSLLDAARVEYQVRLAPIEPAWSTTRRETRYPALPPASYRFAARARIGTGPWGPTTELRFTVRPVWWRTSWLVAASALAGILALATGLTWRQRAVLRRRTRQLHERSDASFRAVLDLMPDLISVHRDGHIIYVNQACRRFLGIDTQREPWDPQELARRVHPDDLPLAAEQFVRIRELDGLLISEVIEIRVRAADGSWRICEVSSMRVEVAGAPTVIASARDVTERKRMRAKLLVSDRMASLGTLAAGIAHEINNPLAYVAGNLEAMAETLDAGGDAPSAGERADLRAAIAEARDGAERMRKIVQSLRSFSRTEEEDRVPLALPGVLEAAIRLTGNEVRHRAELVRELGPVPAVVADHGQLTQVFINLLVNAAHAIPEGRSSDNRIAVRTRTDEQGRAVVEIEDTGQGMPPEVQARVFDPFFTTKGVGEGTGLGLSICHGIISGLGGQIAIESAPARGTLVRVALPPHDGPPPPEPALERATRPPKKRERRRRVMLVDDEPQIAHTMERLLRRDYDITIALCGREAIEHISRGTRFDAIVSDVMMPNMTGIELIEEIRRIAPDQADRLIFLSGGAFTAQTRERLDELGAPQLQKPVTAKELRAWVTRIVTETESHSR
jgi:PAS domain S-box-containing protein